MKINLEQLKFDDKGLIPVVVQDAISAEVLMVAWANVDSLEMTAETGELVFWSRSRNELWRKGETSGNIMKLIELRVDCDGDTLLAIVSPVGPACHTGANSCFYSTLFGEKDSTEATFLGRLWYYLNKRKDDSPSESYTANLLAKGKARIAQKIGEEGVETAVAVATEDKDSFRYEAADLLYHLLVGCIAMKISFGSILKELASRNKVK